MDQDRFRTILEWLQQEGIKFEVKENQTGKNIQIPSTKDIKIGLGSHYDTFFTTPGANDNGSAVVVCVEIAKRLKQFPLNKLGVEIFIFDEEEKGLIGSREYLSEFGVKGIIGFLNMEMVGYGNRFALWPLKKESNGRILEAFEKMASESGINTNRVDQIVMNRADHESFRKRGVLDSFTVTCVTDKDMEVAEHYYKAVEFEVDQKTLNEIIMTAPIFDHYHQPTDLAIKLSEKTLQMTLETVWRTLIEIDDKIA